MKRLVLAGLVAAVVLAFTAAAAPAPRDLFHSYYLTQAGTTAPLTAGATYRASLFPIPVHVTAAGTGWRGVQWKSGTHYFQGGGPPNFGWVHIGRGPTDAAPDGLITIMTAYGKTPSVAAVVTTLRTRGRGATYDAASPVTLAGYSGIQFDGRITGAKNVDHTGHYFIPFSPPSHAAKYYPDEYPVYGDVFRVLVVDVRGKTVIVYIENVALPQERFPAFLSKAGQILSSLRFPAA